jgi:hypothetical protein
VGSPFDVQAAEQTAHLKSGPRRRPGNTSERCTQIGEQPFFSILLVRLVSARGSARPPMTP